MSTEFGSRKFRGCRNAGTRAPIAPYPSSGNVPLVSASDTLR
jgi:hypothetical protein